MRVPVKCEWCPCVKCDTRYSEAGLNKFAIVENIRRITGVCVSYSVTIIRVPWETAIGEGPVIFCIYGEVYYLIGSLFEYLDDAVLALNGLNIPGPRGPVMRWGEYVCGAWEGDYDYLSMQNPVTGWWYDELFPVSQEWLCNSCS